MNIQVLNEAAGISFDRNLIIQYIQYCARLTNNFVIDLTTKPCNTLAVTHYDLQDIVNIDWQNLNLIFAETCQQIYDYQYKLDNTKAYVFITESAADFDYLKNKFYGVPIIGHFAIFNEILDYGKELYSVQSHLTTIPKASEQVPNYDFFCLIGRKTNLRGRFVTKMSQLDLEKSLLKYNGKIIEKSGAPHHYDQLDYAAKNFYNDYFKVPSGMTLYSKVVQPQLYQDFKFEVQYETDAYESVGWEISEYHITEKTIKPLIMNKPCLMYGAPNYHRWLASYGIDLGHGNFDVKKFDDVECDESRVDALIKYLGTFDNFDDVMPNNECFKNNIFGLYLLAQFSFDNLRRLANLLQNH